VATDEHRAASGRAVGDVARFPQFLHEPGSIGYLEKLQLAQLLLVARPRLVVETGTFRGLTTRFAAELLELNGLADSTIASFDLPDVIERVQRDPFFASHSSVRLVPGMLPGSLAEFLEQRDEPVDVAIVDADHSYGAVSAELSVLHGHLRPGGYVFCHDYREGDPLYEGVVYAVDSFAQANGYDLLALHPVERDGEEVVWGSAVLRRPFRARSITRRRSLYFAAFDGPRTRLLSALSGLRRDTR
jgi:predicted O-methyltransferase YrrM